jgi:hypothetical protein
MFLLIFVVLAVAGTHCWCTVLLTGVACSSAAAQARDALLLHHGFQCLDVALLIDIFLRGLFGLGGLVIEPKFVFFIKRDLFLLSLLDGVVWDLEVTALSKSLQHSE